MNVAAFRRLGQPTTPNRLWSLIQEPGKAEGMDADEARHAIAEIAATQSTLAALQCVLLARLVTSTTVSTSQADENLSVGETARRTGMSTSYLYKNAPNLPFTVRIGARVLFSARGLERWQKQQQMVQRS